MDLARPRIETGRIAQHPFLRVGSGPSTPLLAIPGLNDPLQRVTDSRWFAAAMATYYRRYADDRPVYVVSRPRGLPATADTRSMARRYGRVATGICRRHDCERIDALGLSMGGFLVAHLAADRPDLVRRAVLALAADRLAARGRRVVERWHEYARRSRWGPIYREAADVVATGWRRRTIRAVARVYDRLADPVAPGDVLVTARATLDHDAGDRLASIDRPVLVVGGDGDPFFSLARFRATARTLPDGRFARLHGASHEAVIEHPAAFEGPIRTFLGPTGSD